MVEEELLGPQMKALTKRRRAFVEAMFQNPFGSRRDWALAAGYSDVKEGAKVRAHEAYSSPKVQAAIAEYGRTLIGTEGVALAIHGLLNIARNGEHPKHDRAVEMILNRTGFGEKQQIEVVHRDLTGDALMERIAALAAKHGVDLGRLGVAETRSVSREAEPSRGGPAVIEHIREAGDGEVEGKS